MREERYASNIALRELGARGQERLSQKSIVVAGCGGLGCTAAELLVRAGVGKVSLVDFDLVEESNLSRQALFEENDVGGKPKAMVAAEKLRRINSMIEIEALVEEVNENTAERIVSGADLVIDCTDNYEARAVLNQACLKLGKPLVFGAAQDTYGMVMTIVPFKTACFKCLAPKPAQGSCTGVLNVLPSLVASIQAAQAINFLITGKSSGKLLTIDAWNGSFKEAMIEKRKGCECGKKR